MEKRQKKLTALDKEVDVYCAWIDQAGSINKKGQGQIGLVGDSEEDDDDFPKVRAAPKKKTIVARDSDSEEEFKEIPNPEKAKSDVIAEKYNAVDKIADLGLGAGDLKKIKTDDPLVFDPAEIAIEKTPQAPLIKKAETKTPGGDADNDSDDLF